MALNAYDPCPCGSGKKLKFCCQNIVDEMERIQRLAEGNQPRVALQQLESLSRKVPDNAWVATTRAMILLEIGEPLVARDILRALLETQPDHDFAIALLAAAVFQGEGLDAAKKPLHRAFQKSAKKYPAMVSGLASMAAMVLSSRQRLLAAREHLSLALRLASEKQRQELFVQLLEFDGDESIPYPLRGSHLLPSFTGTEEQQKEIKKAQKYAAIGCWSTAADLFVALARSMNNSAEAWHSAGLCRAWDGDQEAAAEALHHASRLYGDFAAQVECETMAQIFDLTTTKNVVEICTYEARIESVSRLLSSLDNEPRLYRLPENLRPQEEQGRPAASYQILDRPRLDTTQDREINVDDVPKLLAHFAIYDAIPDDNEPAMLFLSGDRGADLEAAKSLVTTAAGSMLTWTADKPQPTVTGAIPADSLSLRWGWVSPHALPPKSLATLARQQWKRTLDEVWPNAKQYALGGRSPIEAAKEPNMRVESTAAVFLLDANCQQRAYDLNLDEVFTRLGLPTLPPLEITEETLLSGLTVMEMHRLPIDQLSDAQLTAVVNRALLTHHHGFLYRVLTAALARPNCVENIDLPRVHRELIELCSRHGKRSEAFHWIDVARNSSQDGKSQFETQWTWDMTELSLRLEEPNDPLLKPLLDRFVNFYAPKVPQIRGYVEQMLAQAGVPSPWESISVVSATGTSGSGVWTPDSESNTASSSGSKLWLPGQ